MLRIYKGLTLCRHLFHLHTELMRHVANDAEDDKAGEKAGATVAHPDQYRVPEHVVLKLVVAGQGDHAAPGDAQREEDLDTGIRPNLKHGELLNR